MELNISANLVPGGKSLSGGQQHSPVIQVRVSAGTKEKLQTIAEARKVSISKLSRQVLDNFVLHLGEYHSLVWRGPRNECDGDYRNYAISGDLENEFLIQLASKSVNLKVRRLGEWRKSLFATFPQGEDDLQSALHNAQARAEHVNRRLWASQLVQR